MPTPKEAFAIVAHVVAQVPLDDEQGIKKFFMEHFANLSETTRGIIGEWLITCEKVPDEEDISVLRNSLLNCDS